jgi:hypothetical protein
MSSNGTHTVFYVSIDGDDTWSGQLPARSVVGSDGPFASLARARDAIRALKQTGPLPAGGVTVFIRAGDYVLDNAFVLSLEDSGTTEAPICYRAYNGERARLLGGRVVTNFRPVSDPTILARFDEPAREHIFEADLQALGITDFGQFQSRGLGRPTVPAHLELFFNGKPMTVARWPDDDFTRIAGYPQEGQHDDEHGHMIGGLTYGFHYDGDRPRRWKSFDNVWLHGYWANSYEEVESIDTIARLIKTKPPHGSWGFRTGNRFYFLNVLEELDKPGEYYVDRSTGMLYFWPPAPLAASETLVSVLETPLILLDGASNITLQDLTLEAGRGMGVQINGGSGNTVANCTLRNLGIHAVSIEGGTNHSVSGCDISETGDGGIFISGGDRKSLTPCNHTAHNNHIYRLSRWSRCYTPAIHASGVGIRMTHNLIHDLPHSGIIFWGNEMLIEYNEIHHVTLESADAGAIYTGRDFTARGNLIRYNYIHDNGGYDWGTMAVYLDDCSSGQTIYGNVFARVQRAAFVGGGRENTVENNIFVDCKPAVWVDARGLDKREVWHNMIYRTMKERLEAMNYHQLPYSERYPELAQLDAYYAKDDGVPPENNVVARNICVGGTWLEANWHTEEANYAQVIDNLVDADPHFVDAAHDDYRLQADSPALKLGFKPIPIEQIGLVKQ